ncbi:MAG: hypothetical protein M1812_005315 [Candelaria pacifica]|nr:MAG: hypothetical protein M1812_005315 [Candelaria pacifica]
MTSKILHTSSVDLAEIASILSAAASSMSLPAHSVDIAMVASEINAAASTHTVDLAEIASIVTAAASTHTVDLAEIASIVTGQMRADSTGSSKITSSRQSSATPTTSVISSPSPTSNWFSYSTTTTPTPTPTGGSATSTPLSLVTSAANNHKRNLTIILSVILTILAIAILASVLLLIRRYRRRRVFLRRSITPIDDEEIDSWRMRSTAGGYSNPATPHQTRASEQQEWTSEKMPRRPSVARAPNSRTGLTDDAIPGADPFVTPPRRHSGKLHKSPHHSRNNTARSSVEDRPPTPYQEWREEVKMAGAPRRPQVPHLPSRTESFEREQARFVQQKWR